ncbi:hypothetical protein ACLRGF_07785 [Mycetocola zhadangensis]|uniref:hypothetical protein n=1 Tax=Mycetocola zhadangensis TaxID=1164595 RepID=UPI003A4E5871
MKMTTVRVDGQMFVLKPGEDVEKLKAEVTEAARSGAGFVEFETVGRSTLSVMVTPHVGVRFESIEKVDAEVEQWETHPPAIDFDFFGTYGSEL